MLVCFRVCSADLESFDLPFLDVHTLHMVSYQILPGSAVDLPGSYTTLFCLCSSQVEKLMRDL